MKKYLLFLAFLVATMAPLKAFLYCTNYTDDQIINVTYQVYYRASDNGSWESWMQTTTLLPGESLWLDDNHWWEFWSLWEEFEPYYGGEGGGGGASGSVSFNPSTTNVQVGETIDFHVWANNNAGLSLIGLELCNSAGTPVDNRGEIVVSGTSADNIFTVGFDVAGTYYFDCYYWSADHTQLVRSGVTSVTISGEEGEDRGEHPEFGSQTEVVQNDWYDPDAPELTFGFEGIDNVQRTVSTRTAPPSLGRWIYYFANLFSDELAAKQTATWELIPWMRANSPTFRATLDREKDYSLTIAPVSMYLGGGFTNRNAWFGTLSGTNRAGTSIIYPALVLAHEIGHADERYGWFDSSYHPDWKKTSEDFLPVNNEKSPARKWARDPSEYYATKYAQQVAAEILQNTGKDIGQVVDYYDIIGPGVDRGLAPAH